MGVKLLNNTDNELPKCSSDRTQCTAEAEECCKDLDQENMSKM